MASSTVVSSKETEGMMILLSFIRLAVAPLMSVIGALSVPSAPVGTSIGMGRSHILSTSASMVLRVSS